MSATERVDSSKGTVKAPKFYEGAESSRDDVHVSAKVFTYDTADGLVAGYQIALTFTIDRPAAAVWAHFKNWDSWQNSHGYHYSGAPGDLYSNNQLDLGKETFRITVKNNPAMMEELGLPPDGEYETGDYVVLRVIPEHMILVFQPVPEGKGAVSPGIHAFLLHEHGSKTTVAGNMEHAALAEGQTDEEAIAYWRDGGAGVVQFWTESFIPELKRLVLEG